MAAPVFDSGVFDSALFGGSAELFDGPDVFDPAVFETGEATAGTSVVGSDLAGAYGVLLPSATRFKTEPAIEVPIADPTALFAVYALTRVVPIMSGYGKESVEGPNA